MIDWSAFSWDAFATLTTGVAAVGAATVVAVRQLGIVRRQVELQELQLRHELFDRRAAVFNSIREYVGSATYNEAPPDYVTFESYFMALDTARFVFSTATYLELMALKSLVSEYVALLERFSRLRRANQEILDETYLKKKIEVRRRYDALPALVEPEMSLVNLRRSSNVATSSSRLADWWQERRSRPDHIGTSAAKTPIH